MKLRFITCSDPRENIPVESILNFATKYPISEIGLGAYPASMLFNKYYHIWFDKIIRNAQNMPTPPNIALHINHSWCDQMCKGVIPHELDWYLQVTNVHTKQPVIKRIQLNTTDYSRKFDPKGLVALISQQKDQEFILLWNERMTREIGILKQTGAKFSLLFDGSNGTGIEPNAWHTPTYNDIPNGYAGGLGPDNITKNLDKINAILPKNRPTWIDAKGKLCDKETTFSFTLELAEEYVKNTLAWFNQRTK